MNRPRSNATRLRFHSRHGFCLTLLVGLMVAALGQVFPSTPAFAAPTDPAPSLTIVNPVYFSQKVAQGPVGTNVTVVATGGWTIGATIQLGVVPGVIAPGNACDPTAEIPVSPVAPITVDGNGAFNGIFVWPSSAQSSTPYSICANEENGGTKSGASTNTFSVLSAVSPALQLPPAPIHAGDTVTISGTNWLPPAQPISLYLETTNLQPFLLNDPTTTLTDQNGNFTVTLTMPQQFIGSRTIVATMGTPTSYQKTLYYPLQFSSPPYEIQNPVFTPTATTAPPTPTTIPQPTATVTTNTPPLISSSTLLVALLALVAIVLLVTGLVVAVLALRGRDDPPSGGAGPTRDPNRGSASGNWDDGYTEEANWNQVWQNPSGQPWSGRLTPTYRPEPLEEDEDPYRTRMGDAPPVQQAGQPGQPRPQTSRPTQHRPPLSRPVNQPGQNWGEDTMANSDTNPNNWPPNPPIR